MKIHSNGDWVEITAKKGVLINGGESYIKISAEGIEHGTKGKWDAHAADHIFAGPQSAPLNLENPLFNDEMFVLKNSSGAPIAGFKYKIIDNDGNIFYGVTNAKGETDRVLSGAKNSNLKVFPDDRNMSDDEE